MHIKFPALLTIRNADAIIQRCEKAILSKDEKVLFDFSICSFSDPFAITLLAGAMKACISKGHVVEYMSSPNRRLEEYFKNIGFYSFGGSAVGASPFASQQVELQHLNALDPAYTDAVVRVLQNNIQMSQGVKDSLHLSINELMTNTFDHSQTMTGCFICAQAYKSRGQVSICLTDFGRGILTILSSVPEYSRLKTSLAAIELAVKEGVSSRTGRLSGLGLTHIQRFLQINEGQMHIISGDGWVHWNFQAGSGVKIRRKRLVVAFDGTIVNIIARADGEGFYLLSSEVEGEPIF